MSYGCSLQCGHTWPKRRRDELRLSAVAGRQPAQYRILRIRSHCAMCIVHAGHSLDAEHYISLFLRIRRQQWLLGRRGRRLMAPGRHLGHAGDGGRRARPTTPLQGGRIHAAVRADRG